MIRVSVIVPVYGVEAYIGKCARSLFAQTYPHIQFIFVDDGTPDRSVDVLNEVIDKEFPHLRERILILHKENGGLPQARLTGLQHADGDYVMHVDSDDWVEPDAVASLVEKAEETGADIVFHDFWKEYPSRSKLDRERDYTAADKMAYIKGLYTYRAYGYLWNKFARRSLYEGVFTPKYNMHEDIVVANQLIFKATSLIHLPKALYHYRRDNPGASTRVALKRRRGQSARNFLDLYEHFKPCLAGSPIEHFTDEILLRAAWIGFTLDRSLFAERPYLKREARAVSLRSGCFVGIFKQLILKLFLAF
jgi:glycosyltransferase involved in cell wall biosynthesis